ncbi:MAG: hypothetical protein Q8J88_01065 [Bacteroidales bacterium]|nr:hypothetical protein [Bacteroidales bacterium]
MKIIVVFPDGQSRHFLSEIMAIKEVDKQIIVIDDKPQVKEVLEEITELKIMITPRPEIEYQCIGVSNERDMRKRERQEWKYRQKHYQHRK